MFYDRLKLLCDQKGISTYKACNLLGLNRSAVAKWKTGATPRGDTLSKIAAYFEVPVDSLLSNEEIKPASPSENPSPVFEAYCLKPERVKEIIRLFEQLSPEAQEIFFVQLKAVAAAQEKERLFQK